MVSTTVGEVRAYIDGTERITKTGLNTGAVDAGRVYIMFYQVPWATDAYFDCVVVADTYIGPEAAAQTYTKTWTTDSLFKKLGIPKTLGVDTTFQKQDIPKSFAVDARFGGLVSHTISRQLDAVLKKMDATKTFGLDVHFGAIEAGTYAKIFALDAIFAYKVRLPELWLDENGKIVLNISKPYTWVGS